MYPLLVDWNKILQIREISEPAPLAKLDYLFNIQGAIH